MIGNNPVITIGTIGAILAQAWVVLVDQGLLDGLTSEAQGSLTILIGLLIPIVAAVIASRFVTPTASPVLTPGTQVNERSAELPTSTVTPNE